LLHYDWPGNARELANIVQRAAWLAVGGSIDAKDLDTGAVDTGAVHTGAVHTGAEHTGAPTPGALMSTAVAAAMAGPALPVDARAALPPMHAGLDQGLKEREQELILATLRVTGGSRKLAAERLGISPRTLRHKLQQFKAAGLTVPRAHDQLVSV
jgi:two-component system response regulator FlrC